MSVAWGAYRMLAPALGVLAPHASVFASPSERPLWKERMGRVNGAARCDAWIHAASLGEASAAAPLVRELQALDSGATFRLTATTRTGRERLGALALDVSLAPIDSPQAVRNFLRAARPARLIVIETEIWPHWLLAARSAALPVAFVSARLSDRSMAGYRRLGRPLRDLVAGAAAVLCQSEADAARWRALGAVASRTAVTGNLKFDALPQPAVDRGAARAALRLDPHRPLLTLGSLRPGEARPLARAWRALAPAERAFWQVAAVPRHARALDALRSEAGSEGIVDADHEAASALSWRWEARSGVLNDYYAASDAAFVGASLVPLGGHNPLEPAATGAAVIMGPHVSHQRTAVDALHRLGAIAVCDAEHLAATLSRVLGDAAVRAAMSRGGLGAVTALRGAARRSVVELALRGFWPVAP